MLIGRHVRLGKLTKDLQARSLISFVIFILQYGFNRISQLCHLHMSGFTFHVLQNAFLLHLGFKEKNTFHNKKDEDNEINKLIYRKVKSELLIRYQQSGRHC